MLTVVVQCTGNYIFALKMMCVGECCSQNKPGYTKWNETSPLPTRI